MVHQKEFYPFQGKIVEKTPVVDTDQYGRPVRATATLTNNLESYMTKAGKGVGHYRDLHASKRAKAAAKVAETTHPVKPPWKENDTEKHPFRPGNAAAEAFAYNGPLAGPTSTGGSEAASVATMEDLVLLTLPWLLLAQIALFSTKHATLDPVWEQPVADRKRPRLRRKRANDPAATTYRKRLGHSSKWYGMTAGSIMVFYGIRDYAAAFGVRDVRMLWEGDAWNPCPFVSNAMSRNAYDQHAQFLRYYDVAAAPNHGDYDGG